MSEKLSNEFRAAPRNASTQLQAERARIAKSVQELLDLLEAQGFIDKQSYADKGFDLATHSHEVFLRSTRQMNTAGTIALNNFLNVETRAMEKAQTSALTAQSELDEASLDDESVAQSPNNDQRDIEDEDDMVMLQGVKAALHDRTASLAYAVGGTEAYIALDGIWDYVPRYVETLLLEFFSVCRDPNDAEIRMLEQACGLVGFAFVRDWCKSIII
ncbi:hypothetical protein LTR78_005775 [Recurvomyces mirabilis]|uniref:Uncharacterized protein n=1 Tax=Recurvomyces mirabilis TaxID=574656 RepID=A0AAE1C122_9PEZI|nr:hypothetical protein LTR78_005775 [Recurvomyces mirabilis]KAK5154155.1 hypothetical protein LTS14_006840 [Recurvomyces mirabilis]